MARAKKGIGYRQWPTEVLPVTNLVPADYNPRQIAPDALRALEASMKRWGIVQPIIVNRRTGRIVGGHQRARLPDGSFSAVPSAGPSSTPTDSGG